MSASQKNGANNGPKSKRVPPVEYRFKPGNPGRPKGSRHKTTLAIQALLEGEADALTRRAIEAALGGDNVALRLCLERLAPPVREGTVQFDAPKVRSAADVPDALASILSAVAAGDLTPTEGAALAALLDRYRSAYELDDLERRIAKLEETTP